MAKLTAKNSLRMPMQCAAWARPVPYKGSGKPSWAWNAKRAKSGIVRVFVHDGQGNLVLQS